MRMTRRGRCRAATLLAVLLTVVVAGTPGWPGTATAAATRIETTTGTATEAGTAASAGVTITTVPAEVRQRDAVEVTVVLPEERAGTRTTRIELRMPVDAPVGEVYPLSVPGWAPRITTRTLDRPVAGIHAPELNQVTGAVTWIRMPGAATGPTRLPLGMGPMPAVDRLAFQVVRTYADGTVIRWADPPGGAHPAPTVTLLPALPRTGGHAGHGGSAARPAAPGPAVAAPAADQDGPSADLLLGAGLLAGLGAGAVVGWLLSRRRRGPLALAPDATLDVRPAPGETGEPVLSGRHAPATPTS